MTPPLKKLPLILILLAVTAALPPVRAQQPGNWLDPSWNHRLHVKAPGKGSGYYHVRVLTGPRARPDGRDFRMADPAGRPIPLRVVHSTDTGEHLLMFPRSEEAEKDQGNIYMLYFGNLRASRYQTFTPKAGLTLRTRPLPEGADVSSWENARRALEKSETVYGMAFHGRVFDGYNPFGPQRDYISIYNGIFRCPEPGTYRFAVMSEDASFLFIDGEKVAEWTGRGHNINRGRHGQHGGEVDLSAGPHRLRYVAFAFGRPRRCGVAWSKPGEEKKKIRGSDAEAYPYRIMGGGVFGHVPAAQVLRCENRTKRVCADFTARPAQYLESGDARMVAVRFRSHSYVRGSTVESFRWDFGDGQTSTQPNPAHVYLAPGTYEVALTVKAAYGVSDTFKTGVKVEPVWNDLDFRRPKKQRFWQWTSDYEVENAPTAHLLAFQDFLRDVEQRKKLAEVCIELDKRRKELTPVQTHEVAMDLGKHYLRAGGDWQMAEKYFRLAHQSAPEDDLQRRFNARFQLADVYFYYADQPEKAQRAYRSLRHEFPATDPVQRRVALIRLGDIERNQGNLKEAHELYRQAQNDPEYGPQQPLSILEGRYVHDVRAFLNEGKAQRALDELQDWLWKCPTQRLEGLPFILRLKANLQLENYQEVTKQADIYLGFAKDPDYIPQAHLLAGEAYLELGFNEKARKHWQTVVEEWKESPAAQHAANNLRRLKQMGG